MILIVLLCSIGNANSDDIKCSFLGMRAGFFYIDLQNDSDSDLVIMGGKEDKLVKVGLAYLSKESNSLQILLFGKNLGILEKPDLILLPSKYTRSFRYPTSKLTDSSQIIQLAIGFKYLTYPNFSSKMKQDQSMGFAWDSFSKSILYERDRIKKLKSFYSFGLGLGNSESDPSPK